MPVRAGVLLVTVLALMPCLTAWAEPDAVPPAAVAAYRDGMRAVSKRNFRAALVSFRRSFAIYPSPNVRLAIARCLTELGSFADAALEYEATILDARDRAASQPEYARARDAALLESEHILSKIGRLKLEFDRASSVDSVTVNGRTLEPGAVDRPVPVPPGRVIVEVSFVGAPHVRRELEIAQGVLATEHFDASPPLGPAGALAAPPGEASSSAALNSPDEPGTTRATLGWVSVGVAAVGIGAYVAFRVLASAQFDDLVATCVDKPCASSRRGDLESTGQTYETLMYVGLGVGVAAALVGAGLLTWDALDTTQPEVEVARHGATIGMRTRF